MFHEPTMVPPPPPHRLAPNTTNDNTDSANNSSKRKRRPAGTPDPDAEVVALSPKTLLESDRYVCEICNQGFQRDQNLQMHRRRHKVPWKLLKRETPEARKRVFVCPEPTCLHHDPCHALGDLVGIKKHYRRKHSDHKQWVCARCSKAYAVQSDYKAHLKTCGTRGHSCDCGRVFSRVESFIEHQDICNAGHPAVADISPAPRPSCQEMAAGAPNLSSTLWLGLTVIPPPTPTSFPNTTHLHHSRAPIGNPELQLLPTAFSLASPTSPPLPSPPSDNTASTQLHLSIGSAEAPTPKATDAASAAEQDKKAADEERRQARRQVELAEAEFAKARRMRQEALMELSKAQLMRDRVVMQINSTLLQITCLSCKQQLLGNKPSESPDGFPFPVDYASSTPVVGDYHESRKDSESASDAQ